MQTKLHWDDIRFVLEVSRHPKLTKAAQHSGQDASTISRRLKRLEGELGILLFERTRHGHVLTPEGQEIVHKAEVIEQKIHEVVSLSERTETQLTGKVRLGVTEGLGTSVIAPAIADFLKAYPGIDLDLIAMSGFANVSRREADMAIMLARPQTGRLRVRKLTEYTLRLYATLEYQARAPVVSSLEDLQKHALIGYVDEMIYSPQLRYYDEVAPGLSPRLCSPSIVAQLEMTRASAGIAILPDFMARRYPDLQPILPDEVSIERTFWLVTHEDVASLSRIRAVSEFLDRLLKPDF